MALLRLPLSRKSQLYQPARPAPICASHGHTFCGGAAIVTPCVHVPIASFSRATPGSARLRSSAVAPMLVALTRSSTRRDSARKIRCSGSPAYVPFSAPLDGVSSGGDPERILLFRAPVSAGPLKDDRDLLFGKMMMSDGVVFASPVYSFQVSGQMKIFLDRLGFVFHRPRFQRKAFTSVVIQAFFGGNDVMKYLDFVGGGIGFDVVKGACITGVEPQGERDRRKMDEALAALATRFHALLLRPARGPSLFRLWAFRWGRTAVARLSDKHGPDYQYYRDRGWLESDYYYPTRLGLLKRAAGAAFDVLAARSVKQRAA